MLEKEIEEQTAFETAGIPTPPDQQHIAATDPVSGIVEGIIDNITAEFDDTPEPKHR
ncbi:hypothetical protein [Paenibacillus xerothermodurans]|uniref:hypothetical protein n=1 Tax=Paenibacillus xerothermodurans TaxID=1977292 RepID=UPI001401EC5C|nr:hypothetical protein [Paenibacillus xerothermodurans]